MSPEQQQRYADLHRELRIARIGSEPVTDGYRLAFADDHGRIGQLAELVSLERLCCPFLSLAIEVTAFESGVTLRISGPAGAQELIAQQLNL